jgi:hypothetical protein
MQARLRLAIEHRRTEPMIDLMLAWAKGCRSTWLCSLKGLRSGVLGTSELRDGKRVDTTLETIAEHKRDIALLDAVIVRQETDDAQTSLNDHCAGPD